MIETVLVLALVGGAGYLLLVKGLPWLGAQMSGAGGGAGGGARPDDKTLTALLSKMDDAMSSMHDYFVADSLGASETAKNATLIDGVVSDPFVDVAYPYRGRTVTTTPTLGAAAPGLSFAQYSAALGDRAYGMELYELWRGTFGQLGTEQAPPRSVM